ncbi:uncharacterized protein LOC110854310 [Folsomia candida]|uniref:Uncharacterized protein n=1 Tax=Folsomia candida TaxID=158441 RepID=A0A226DYI8_FOLCA|nr:uncharacterized protein LOC110854310 [Folsomia candida]OXA50353.1 hypothetical protein Fcan01_15316 [Folsomia candida]
MIALLFATLALAAVNAVPQHRPAALGAGPGILGANTAVWSPFVCRDGVMGPNDDRMKGIGACAKSVANQDCVYFCQAEVLGLLDTAGLPRTEIYDKWVEVVFPERHHAVGKAWFRDCYQKYGKFIDKSDQSCKHAKLFGDCTWSIQPQLTCPKA